MTSPPLRILHVHDYGTPSGGAELVALRMRDGLRERGHDARLLTSTARPLPVDVLADATCYGTMGPLRQVLQAINPTAAPALRRELRAFRPDIVHVHMYLTQLSPLVLAPLRDVPAVLHLHNYDQVCPLIIKTLPDGAPCTHRPGVACHACGCLPWRGVARAMLQRRLTRLEVFDRIVANSDWVRRRVTAEGVRVDARIWNGVPWTAARPPLTDPPVVAFAGRLVPEKGAHVALAAMSTVVRALPQARLLLLGDGPDRDRLERLIGALGLEQSVDWPGFVAPAEADRLLGRAWVQVAPSIWEEPFGLVAAEAMVRGTAVVASRAGGLTEQIVDGQTGLTVPPGDADALAGALLAVLRDRSFAATLGAAGRERARAEFTEERMIDRWLALYEELRPRSGERRAPAAEHTTAARA